MRTPKVRIPFRRAALAGRISAALAASAATAALAGTPPYFQLYWSPTTTPPGATSNLYFYIVNQDPTLGMSTSVSTLTYPAGLTNTGVVYNFCSGSGTATPTLGSNTVSLTTAGMGVSDYCQVGVEVTSASAGTYSLTVGLTQFMATFSDSTFGGLAAPFTTSPALTFGVPAVTPSTTTLNFGNVAIGTTAPALGTTLSNTGTADWEIYNIGSPSCYGGPICYGGAEFICSTSCSVQIPQGAEPGFGLKLAGGFGLKLAGGIYPPGTSCVVSASFSPTFTGPQSATVQLCSNVPDITISITGTGVIPPPLVLSPPSVNFGTVPVGSSVGAVMLTLTNPGTTPVGINSISTTGPFSVASSNCGNSLAPSSSCLVGASFTAPSEGTHTGTLDVATASGGTLSAMLQGAGTVQPELLLPALLEFAHVIGSAEPTEQVVPIQNTGLAPLAITSIAVTGANFTLSNDCPATVAPGGRCLARIRFATTQPGTYNGAFTVVSNAAGGTSVTTLRGVAQPRPIPTLELTPREIGFGNRALGTMSAGQRITVKNVGGAPANLTRFDVSPDFLILSNSCGAALQSLAECEAMVAMRPVAYGMRYGAFTVISNADNNPTATTLSGTGCRVGGFLFGRSGGTSSCGQ